MMSSCHHVHFLDLPTSSDISKGKYYQLLAFSPRRALPYCGPYSCCVSKQTSWAWRHFIQRLEIKCTRVMAAVAKADSGLFGQSGRVKGALSWLSGRDCWGTQAREWQRAKDILPGLHCGESIHRGIYSNFQKAVTSQRFYNIHSAERLRNL